MNNELVNAELLNKHSTFLGNPLLKRKGEPVQLTPEHLEELRKCAEDPVYFAEKYFTIVNVDTGKEIIKLYDYQKKILRALKDNRQAIILSCRQSGKCCSINTIIKVKNPKFNDGVEFEITLGEFYAWQKLRKEYKEYCKKA